METRFRGSQCAKGLPRWFNGQRNYLQCRRPQRYRFNSWVGRRKLQPTPVFLPGEPHGQRGLAGYGPQVTESDTTEATEDSLHSIVNTSSPLSVSVIKLNVKNQTGENNYFNNLQYLFPVDDPENSNSYFPSLRPINSLNFEYCRYKVRQISMISKYLQAGNNKITFGSQYVFKQMLCLQ